ncbi:MAG: SemiSWEET transporter [Rhizomicrobium sp.]|jgi:MtN3 and saliva related transmembrane protein
MGYVTAIGKWAASCTTIAFLPQAIKTWRTRSTKDISLGMFLIFSLGIALWLIYGLLQHDIPLIAANGITLVLALTILGFKIRHG